MTGITLRRVQSSMVLMETPKCPAISRLFLYADDPMVGG